MYVYFIDFYMNFFKYSSYFWWNILLFQVSAMLFFTTNPIRWNDLLCDFCVVGRALCWVSGLPRQSQLPLSPAWLPRLASVLLWDQPVSPQSTTSNSHTLHRTSPHPLTGGCCCWCCRRAAAATAGEDPSSPPSHPSRPTHTDLSVIHIVVLPLSVTLDCL